MLVAALDAQAQFAFTVSAVGTVEDDIESILNNEAVRKCSGSPASRVSVIKTNYKPYRYYITAWASYVCVD